MPRPTRVLAGLALAGIGLVPVACSDSGPSPDEEAVCAAIQTMVDRINEGDPEAALASISDLDTAVAETDNETMRREGSRLLTAISLPVDYGQLTVQESDELGQRVLDASAGGLDGLIQECEQVGDPIEDLPTGPDLQQ